MFSSMFSQRSGMDQSIAGSVINAIMGHMTQQGGIGNLFSGGNIIQMTIESEEYSCIFQI